MKVALALEGLIGIFQMKVSLGKNWKDKYIE